MVSTEWPDRYRDGNTLLTWVSIRATEKQKEILSRDVTSGVINCLWPTAENSAHQGKPRSVSVLAVSIKEVSQKPDNASMQGTCIRETSYRLASFSSEGGRRRTSIE